MTNTLRVIGERAARREVIESLLARLSDNKEYVRYEAARALKNLSSHIRPDERRDVAKSFLLLSHSDDEERRDVGYVGLRNLLAARGA